MVKQIGPPAFLAGILLSALAGFLWPTNITVMIVVASLGVLVGVLNIADKEVSGFLLASLTFMISIGGFINLGTVFGQLPGLTQAIPAFLGYIVAFVGPAASVVAFKQIWMLAKD